MTTRQFWGVGLALILALLLGMALAPSVTKTDWQAWWQELTTDVENESAEADDDDIDVVPMTVTLDDAAQKLAGIETITVMQSSFFPEFRARATVQSIQPMLAQRAELRQQQAAVRLAEVTAQAARQERDRLQKLSEQTGSIANKDVTFAEAKWQQASASLRSAKVSLENLQIAIRQQWEATMADWIFAEETMAFKRLVERSDSLLLVTLPVGAPLAADVNVIRVAAEGNRTNARKAYFVAPAINVESSLQGETYYFRLSTGRLRSGMRLDAWVPESQSPLSGVMVPDNAIVWYAGQPWAYTEIGDGRYQRVSLRDMLPAAEGVFDESGQVSPGSSLVIDGAQTLLSEEFKWQIQDDDDD